MTWKAYEAMSVTHPAILPIEDAVFAIIYNAGVMLKREEIITMVSVETNIYRDEVARNISHVLRSLQKQKLVDNVKHGYWTVR